MTPDPPHEQILHRFEVLSRHIAYLDERFDDSTRRLEQAEHAMVSAVDDLGSRVEGALDRTSRLHLTAFAFAQVGLVLVLLTLAAAVALWAWP